MTARYTFIWWGDGYAVYDGDEYIGKDDQVSAKDMLFDAGLAVRIDAEEKFEQLDAVWGEPLPVVLAALGGD